jgi:DNA topoisomerase-1
VPRIVYSDGTAPGITRRQIRGKWAYFSPDGERITDREEIDRLNAIGLPPAYRDAWFNTDPNGHIQGIGWDEKGRKQYRYHTGFREAQEAAKYEKCADFGRALPKLRRQVEEDLAKRRIDKDHAVAAVIRLLDIGHLRVGNEAYVEANQSYGATTLREEHAQVKGDTLRLRFKGKSGKERDCKVVDKALARTVKKMHDMDEQHLFSWVDENGDAHSVTSGDVNDYIHRVAGDQFSAKHFRTWGASVTAFEALATASSDLKLKAMLEPVVERLGNTPAIARKSYVHPALIDLVKKGQSAFRQSLKLPRSAQFLSREERALIAFLDALVPAIESPAVAVSAVDAGAALKAA